MFWILVAEIYVFLQIYSCYESCREIILSDRLSQSGIYNLTNPNNETYEVHCAFEGLQGYTFISMETSIEIDITKLYTDRSSAVIRHLQTDKVQKEVKVEQLSSYKDQTDLGFFYNTHTGYSGPYTNNGQLRYIYLGFLPVSLAAFTTRQGYRAGGTDFPFNNCDANPNSYIAFYLNVNSASMIRNGASNDFMKGWITHSTDIDPDKYMNERFYCYIEMHMGGCGGLSTTPGFGNILASLGLLFDIPPGPCDSTNPCENNGTCETTSTSFTCLCSDGYHGKTCQYKTVETECSCPCSVVGNNKWSNISNLNLTREEIKHMIKKDLEELQEILKIDSNKTSSFRRLKMSAPDKRQSAASVGFFGIFILCIPITLMILADLSHLFQT